jgi:VCBS repeat-containing protein
VNNTNAQVQALRTTSNTLTETFNYTMRDTAGVTSTSTLVITIQGANDAPVAVADAEQRSRRARRWDRLRPATC